jgi:hypothetical protein
MIADFKVHPRPVMHQGTLFGMPVEVGLRVRIDQDRALDALDAYDDAVAELAAAFRDLTAAQSLHGEAHARVAVAVERVRGARVALAIETGEAPARCRDYWPPRVKVVGQ